MEIVSKYQQAIFDYIRDGSGHLVVTAVAGSGKTTTALQSLDYIDRTKKVLFLAFNKSIASTLQARVPLGVKASTIHSLGFGIVKQLFPNAEMDPDKVYHAIQLLSKENGWKIPKDERVGFMNRVQRISNLMRLTLRSTLAEAEEICERFGIENDCEEATYAMELYEYVINDKSIFDFNDMIFIPATNDFKARGYDFIYVDEFQDCSIAQYRFLRKMLGPKGRLIVIGDRNQAIYGFLGSEPRLFDEALAVPNTVSLPLSISYRCGKEIVEYAKNIVPHIESKPGAQAGKVVKEGSIKNIKDGDFVLCRINFPLVRLCLDFLKEGRKAIIKGNDVGKNLIAFIKPWQGLSVGEMNSGVYEKRVLLMKRLLKKFPDRDLEQSKEYQSFMEKLMTLEILSDESNTVQEVILKIEKLFSDDTGSGIILSTVHRAKGLEAENVFIIEPQLIPFPYFIKEQWEIEQERNIDYVARTRAISKLEYVKDWTAFDTKKKT